VSQVVVHAQIVDQVALVQTRSFTAQLLPANFKRTHRESVLTVDHDARRRVGWLAALERDDRSGVWGTWTSDTLELLAIPELFISAELTWEGRGAHTSEIQVVGASIVAETASTCTQPATVLVGDLRRERDRARWRNLPQPMRDRLDRAAEQYTRRSERRHQRDGNIIDLIDYRHAPARSDPATRRYDPPRIEYRPAKIISIT
jgi:hypothetical protein